MSNASEAREARPLFVHDNHTADDIDQVDDREKSFEQHLQCNEFAASEEIKVPSGKRKESQHHVRNHNERFHSLLVTVLRISLGQAIPQESRCYPSIFIQSISLAWLLQQPIESYHLCDSEQGLSKTVSRDPLLPLQ